MHSVAVYLVQRVYGGPEEGGWYYDAGELCTAPELTAFGTTFPVGDEDRAFRMAAEIQGHLDRDWNVADHARALSSVLSAGRYFAQVNDGWPPVACPAEPPATSDGVGAPVATLSGVDPMKPFTVQCEYSAHHRFETTVEAEDPIAACRAAVDLANQSSD